MVEVGSLGSQVVAVRVFCIRRVELALGQGLGDVPTTALLGCWGVRKEPPKIPSRGQ